MGSADGVARPRLYLIDGSGYVYRAFHALPGLGTTRGLPTNAVYGFTTMLAKLLREESPQHVVVVFDAPGETFRDGLFASYKANRAPMPDELRPQLGYIRKVVEALRLPTLEVPGVEADDVIGTLARQAGRAAIETVLVTGDKDLMQLVDERTIWLDPMRERRCGVAEVRERFGVDPALVPDVLGLMGDAIDNIPGVAGIGEKTASALVSRLGPVEQILERLDEVETIGLRGAKKVREMLAREAENARLSKALATIRCDVPITLDLEALRWDGPDPARLRPLFVELEFHSLLRELVPSGEAPEVERCALRTATEVAAALPALCATGTLAVACALDSGRATAGRLTALAVAAPSGPVNAVATPEEPVVLAALGPALGDLAVAKLGGDLKTLRVALARRGIALAGPTFDVSLASYCLNPTRADHGVAALAEELLGEARAPDGDPAETACRAARAAHRLKPALGELLRAHEMERLFRDLEMPLASVLADMELAGVALDVAALGRLSAEMGAEL